MEDGGEFLTMEAELEENRKRKRQRRVGLFPASELDFSVASPFSDVQLVSASGAVLYGSRYSLAARSPVCKQMLLAGMREAQSVAMSNMLTIPFPGMRTEALQVLLEFCTSGCFWEKQVRETPVDVIHAARYFQLTDYMEEVMGRVMETLWMHTGKDLDTTLAETLSVGVECLPTDSEANFFEALVKKIFSRPISNLPYEKLSSQALEFLLSKTLQCSEPWASRPLFYSCEYDIFRYVLGWSCHQLSRDVQQRVNSVLGGRKPEDESLDVDKCVPGTAEALESLATIAGPFLPFVDFRLIHPKQIAKDIEPLEIVPDKMVLAALCHHAKAPNLRTPILYRGPYVLQWSPDACDSGFAIVEYPDGRELYCESITSGFARAHSCLKGGGEHAWIVHVSNPSNPGGIGIGFCSDSEVDYSSNKWLGNSFHGWILDGNGEFWQNGRRSMWDQRLSFGSNETLVQVTVNLDAGTCRFRVGKSGQKLDSKELTVAELLVPSGNRPRLIYPAVSFCQSSGRVSLCPRPCI